MVQIYLGVMLLVVEHLGNQSKQQVLQQVLEMATLAIQLLLLSQLHFQLLQVLEIQFQ
jgi:hypothetical protein